MQITSACICFTSGPANSVQRDTTATQLSRTTRSVHMVSRTPSHAPQGITALLEPSTLQSMAAPMEHTGKWWHFF